MADIPRAKIAVLGGSTTMGSGFPRGYEGVKIIADDLIFETPFGPTAAFTHGEVDGKEFLYVGFHGITREIRNTEPDSSGERVFYASGSGGRGGPRRLRGFHHQAAPDAHGEPPRQGA
jgi:5'-methylthioadenosine phosphorylase